MCHNSHSLVSQIHQGQISAQMSGHGVNQLSLPEQGVTLPVHTHAVSTPSVSFPASLVNSPIVKGTLRQNSGGSDGQGQINSEGSTQEMSETHKG